MEDKVQIPLKIYSVNRMLRKAVVVHSYQDLVNKCKEKFMTGDSPLTIVLNDDGVEIDSEYFPVLTGNSELVLLKGEEQWVPPNFVAYGALEQSSPNSHGSSNGSNHGSNLLSHGSSNGSNHGSNLLEVVNLVRTKKKEQSLSLQTNKKTPQRVQRKNFVKISLGWLFHDGFRYIQIRSPNGGGTRIVDIRWNSSYNDILLKAKELFFPNNVSTKGHWDSFINQLADFKQNNIQASGFTLENYIHKHCLTLKPRIYLMSKEILEDQDFELPDLLETGLEEDPVVVTDSSTDDVLPSFDDTFNTQPMANPQEASLAVPLSSDHDNTLPFMDPTSFEGDTSPVTLKSPTMPRCTVCKDRFCDSFLTCGHIICFICAAEVEERGRLCPVCRKSFSNICKLYY